MARPPERRGEGQVSAGINHATPEYVFDQLSLCSRGSGNEGSEYKRERVRVESTARNIIKKNKKCELQCPEPPH